MKRMLANSILILILVFLNSMNLLATELIKNGSFEKYKTISSSGKEKLVRLNNWKEQTQIWKNGKGRSATEDNTKVSLNAIQQYVTLEEDVTYTLSLDAYSICTNGSKFLILLNNQKIKTVKPKKYWKNYSTTLVGTGKKQAIKFRKLSKKTITVLH